MIGQNIALYRKAGGLSLRELAQQLDLSIQQVQKYESGKNRIAASTLLRVAGILDTHISDFYVHPDTLNDGLYALSGDPYLTRVATLLQDADKDGLYALAGDRDLIRLAPRLKPDDQS